MTAALCSLFSGLCFYFSIGLGNHWALAWIGLVPILWLAFGPAPTWHVIFAAFVAYTIGGANSLAAYAGAIPAPVLVLAILGPALTFALAVFGARRAFRTAGPAAGILAFAILWAALDFVIAFNSAGGSFSTPAANQVDAPMLIQTASIVGFVGVTFIMAIVGGSLAMAARTHQSRFAVAGILVFALNAGYGAWRMQEAPTGNFRVALIASNNIVGKIETDDQAAATRTIDAYSKQVDRLARVPIDLIVLPENIARTMPAWREEVIEPFATNAKRSGATLVSGFNTLIAGAQRNVAMAFTRSSGPVTYQKRRLVPGIETRAYKPGHGARVLPTGIELAICKDMDFHAMIRADIAMFRPILLAVPAWDFRADGWAHARVAMLRSVENGVPMARSARDGWLSINDRYGRVIARKQVKNDFTTLVGSVPTHGRGGGTVYSRIGDLFGWACVVLSIALLFWVFFVEQSASSASRNSGMSSARFSHPQRKPHL